MFLGIFSAYTNSKIMRFLTTIGLIGFVFCLGSTVSLFGQVGGLCNYTQTVIVNGGKFEFTPPYTDYVTVGSIIRNEIGSTVYPYTIQDTIYDQSVQDITSQSPTNPNQFPLLYVATTSHLTVYKPDSLGKLKKIGSVAGLDGASRVIYVKGNSQHPGIVALSRGNLTPSGQAHLVLFDDSLNNPRFVTGISNEASGMAVLNDTLYLGIPGSYTDTLGKLAAISLTTGQLLYEVNFGLKGAGIGKIYAWNGRIITLNSLAYGSPNGVITSYYPGTRQFIHKTLPNPVGDGAGLIGNTLFAKFSGKGIGKYNLKADTLIRPTILNHDLAASQIFISNYPNQTGLQDTILWATSASYSSNGMAYRCQLNNLNITRIDSFQVGISPEALGTFNFSYRCPTGLVREVIEKLAFFPNPATKELHFRNNESFSDKPYTIINFLGQMVQEGTISEGKIDIEKLNNGLFQIIVGNEKTVLKGILVKQ